MAQIGKNKKHNYFIFWGYAAVAAIIVAGCFVSWNFYKDKNTEPVINKAQKDAKQAVIEYKTQKPKVIIVEKQVAKAPLDMRPRAAADVLVMPDAEKREYINAKINYPKNLKAGKKAFSARDYDKAIIYLKLALNAKRSDEVENLLILASEKARSQHIYNEHRAQYELTISHGNKLLGAHKWNEAENVFREARKIPGYEYDSKANQGIQSARDGANVILKKQKAFKELELYLDSASLLLENAKKLKKNDLTAYRKCSAAIQLIADFSDSSHYQYISKRAKQYLAKFIMQAEAYQKTLNPPLPPDLIVERDIRHAPLSSLAPGSRAAQTRQRHWAIKLGLPLEVKTKRTGIKLRLIPPGKLMMGSPSSEAKRNNDENHHHVILLQPFYCGKFEITQKQWKQVMGANPSYFKKSGENAPVEQVSWNNCQEFLKKLCIQEKVPQNTYRLLTEAQWEYACRAGTSAPFCYGNSLDSNMTNFDGSQPYNALHGVFRNKTLPGGSFKANAWGLYDMHGNVWEWCSDWYNIYPYNSTRSGSDRVLRGGSWNISAKDCRSAARLKYRPAFRFNILGFRILRIISQKR
jgi:formylglycine-generating enzyme required for sulfatase activity